MQTFDANVKKRPRVTNVKIQMYTGTLALNAIHNLDLTLAADSSGGIQLLCATLNESHPRARAPQNPLLCTQVPVKQ